MKAIINGKIIFKDEVIENKALLIEENIIEMIDVDKVKEDIEKIDAKGNYVSAGFIDVHIHGMCGHDTMDADYDGLMEIRKNLVKYGVTSFLPTTMTMKKKDINLALENIKKHMKIKSGAKVLGAHLEGPFISLNKIGAQNPEYVLKPDFKIIESHKDIIKILTYAPEEDENYKFTKEVKQKSDITLSIGHSDAKYEKAIEAIERGARSVTHMFNAMTGLHHRDPGIVGAVLNTDIHFELIADNIHVHNSLFKFLRKNKSYERMVLITDAMRATCMKCGEYDLGGQKIIVDEKAARLKSGSLAGSILTMNKAIKNVLNATNDSVQEVIKAVTISPAMLIKEENKIGSLEIGKKADITIFNENIDIKYTIVEGKIEYKAD